MTKHFSAVTEDSPRASKVLVGLFSALIAFVVLALGWQQWIYSQQRADILAIISRQDVIIAGLAADAKALTNRQDILRQRQEQLAEENGKQDVRMSQDFVSLSRYTCDINDLKVTMKDGFLQLRQQIETVKGRNR